MLSRHPFTPQMLGAVSSGTSIAQQMTAQIDRHQADDLLGNRRAPGRPHPGRVADGGGARAHVFLNLAARRSADNR